MNFARKVQRLEGLLEPLPSLVVALSGGVDSAALLGAARRVLGPQVLAATTVSPAVPAEEVEAAAAIARQLGVEHRILPTREMEDEAYRANRGDRCYHCRTAMYGALLDLGLPCVADGLLQDDDVSDRPGVRAAEERGILHPLRAAGFRKADSRRLARAHGLSVHDKPAQPCLASRLPVGIAVTGERLARIHRAESAVRALGFRILRVRCLDLHARIEISREELPRARDLERLLREAVLGAGFDSAELAPYR